LATDVTSKGYSRARTLAYTQLVSLESDDFYSAVAMTVEEARKLLEQGFDYVCQKDETTLFRERK
jgi:NaMN:DMB phosphoribosyltransferase